MKTFFKLLGWLIGLAVLLVVTGHFTLRHALNTPKFKAAATGFIERSTGRLAAYEYIDYTLFPFSLVVQNASLKEKNGRQDFASMKELSLFVDFKTKEVTSVLLDTPSIRIVQHPDGTFNFSDLFPAPAAGEAPTPKPETSSSTTTTGTPAPSSSASPPAEPFAIRLVQIRKAHVEFIALDEENNAESVVLSNIDFQLKDFAPDLPFHMKGSAALGKSSSMQFELSGPPLVEYAHRIGTWPIALDSRLDIVHFSDIQAFLQLLGVVVGGRTQAQREVVELASAGLSGQDIARRLKISEASVSRRRSLSKVTEEEAAWPAVRRLLTRLDSGLRGV